MSHFVEVDQSGKLEQTSWDTVLALSDGIQRSILIPAKVKRAVFDFLRWKYPQRDGVFHLLQFFFIGLYLLLRPCLNQLTRVTIDQEYPGNEGYIKGVLLNYLRWDDPQFPSEGIDFRRVGRGSPSDVLAHTIFEGEKPPDEVITFQHIAEVIQ